MTHHIRIAPSGEVFVDGEWLGTYLTQKEHRFVHAVLTCSHVASIDYLLDRIYEGRDEPDSNTVDVFAHKARRKMAGHREAIKTVWGRGYCRNPDYVLVEDAPVVSVPVDEALLTDACLYTGEAPDALVSRLLKAERSRLAA